MPAVRRDDVPFDALELADALELERDGARHFPAAFDRHSLAALEAALEPLGPRQAGARLGRLSHLTSLIGPADSIARTELGPDSRAVRALLLDKTRGRNWSLGWHQDRAIAMRERLDAPNYVNWTAKAGLIHVEPPFAILERMLTLRIHLDDAGPGNAPLLIAPGSHRIGLVREDEIEAAISRFGARACIARAGDVWLYRAPILHASERALAPERRRVLQLSYSADRLGHGLEWLGVAETRAGPR